MADAAPSGGAPAAAPAAPAAAPQAPAPQQPRAGRASDFLANMEAKNARMSQQPAAATPQPQAAPREQPQQPGGTFAERAAALEQQLLGAPDVDEPVEGAELEPGAEQELAPEEQPQPFAEDDAALLQTFKDVLAGTAALPEEMHDQITVEYTDANGNLKSETVRELAEGKMRLSDYHRGMQQVREQLSMVQMRDQNVRQHFERINDPDVFLQEYEDRGYGQVLDTVMQKLAERKVSDRRVAQAAAWELMQREGIDQNHVRVQQEYQKTLARLDNARKVEAANRQLARQNEQLAQQRQQESQTQEQQQRQMQLGRGLAQLMPVAFKAHRIYDCKANQERLLVHLNDVVRTTQNWDGQVRRSHVMKAAQILREELEDQDSQRRAAPAKPKAKPRSAPPVMGKAARPGGGQPANQPTRKRPSEMQTDPRFSFG